MAAGHAGLGVWHAGALWFSSGGRSPKVRNLHAEARCAVAIQDTHDPVVLRGTAEIVVEPPTWLAPST